MEKKEINSSTILKKSGARFEMVVGIIFMVISGIAYLTTLCLTIFNYDWKTLNEIISGTIFLVLVTLFLGVLFFYVGGYRIFRKSYSTYKTIMNYDYIIKTDILVSKSEVRDSDDGTSTVLCFQNYKGSVTAGSSAGINRGDTYYLVFSLKGNKLLAYFPAKEYYMPGHEDEEQPTEVEIDGEKVIVGEQEKAEEKLLDNAMKFIKWPLIGAFGGGILYAILTKCIGSGFLFGFFAFNLIFAITINAAEIYIATHGKTVQATVKDIKKYDGFKMVVYSFEYQGQEKEVEVGDDEHHIKVGKTYSAYYIPKSGSLYPNWEKKGKKANPDTNGTKALLILAAIGFVLCMVSTYFGM